jgi:hypothetical protein
MWYRGKENKGQPFKKGHRPKNSKPLGAERLTDYGYVQVKVAHNPSTWRLKHLMAWEAAHGPLPSGHKIEFIDGNRQNICLENLRLAPTGPRIGDERIGSKGFIEMRIAPNKWRAKHLVLWEAAHGPLPRTHTLYFLDGDKNNCTIENLYPYPKNGELKSADLARLLHPGQVSNFISILEGMRELDCETNRKAALGAVYEINMRLIAELEFARGIYEGTIGYVKH